MRSPPSIASARATACWNARLSPSPVIASTEPRRHRNRHSKLPRRGHFFARGAERQDDFAPYLGIAQSQLSRIERGQIAPSVEVLLRLRERFGKSVDWILTGEG